MEVTSSSLVPLIKVALGHVPGALFSGADSEHKTCSGQPGWVDWWVGAVYYPRLRSMDRGLGFVGAAVVCTCALVAQLDRASDYGSEGWGFEFLQAHGRSG